MIHTLRLLTALMLGPLAVLQAAEPATSAVSASKSAGLTKGPTATVLRDGKPYSGIGINYFDCFLRTLNKGDDTSYEAGFATLWVFDLKTRIEWSITADSARAWQLDLISEANRRQISAKPEMQPHPLVTCGSASGGTFDAIQLELGSHHRSVANSAQTAGMMANAITAFAKTYLPSGEKKAAVSDVSKQTGKIEVYEEMAEFQTEIAKNGARQGVMIGTTAIARGRFGQGCVICFSPHPETAAGLEAFVLHAIDSVNRKPAGK